MEKSKETVEKKRKKYAGFGPDPENADDETTSRGNQMISTSIEEQKKKTCCTQLAFSIYSKAWEGAKKGIKSNK